MLSPPDMRAVLTALRSDHRFLAIRQLDAVPNEAPGVLIGDRTAQGFGLALEEASAAMPDCTGWALIASDERLVGQVLGGTPNAAVLRQPVTLCQFTT